MLFQAFLDICNTIRAYVRIKNTGAYNNAAARDNDVSWRLYVLIFLVFRLCLRTVGHGCHQLIDLGQGADDLYVSTRCAHLINDDFLSFGQIVAFGALEFDKHCTPATDDNPVRDAGQ